MNNILLIVFIFILTLSSCGSTNKITIEFDGGDNVIVNDSKVEFSKLFSHLDGMIETGDYSLIYYQSNSKALKEDEGSVVATIKLMKIKYNISVEFDFPMGIRAP